MCRERDLLNACAGDERAAKAIVDADRHGANVTGAAESRLTPLERLILYGSGKGEPVGILNHFSRAEGQKDA